MDDGTGWMPDPEHPDQERYWSGSTWTDRVRPATGLRSLHLPDHVPELQRALAAATADIDAVEARLSVLFDRSDDRAATTVQPARDRVDSDSDHDVYGALDIDGDGDDDESNGDSTDDIGSDGNGEVSAAHGDDPLQDVEPIHMEFADPSEGEEGEGDPFAELDAALASEEPDESEQVKHGPFRRKA